MPFEKDPDEIGALWIKSGARGEYMTGTINSQPVVLFKNDRKREGSKAPDWRVLKAKAKEELAKHPPAPKPAEQDDEIPW